MKSDGLFMDMSVAGRKLGYELKVLTVKNRMVQFSCLALYVLAFTCFET